MGNQEGGNKKRAPQFWLRWIGIMLLTLAARLPLVEFTIMADHRKHGPTEPGSVSSNSYATVGPLLIAGLVGTEFHTHRGGKSAPLSAPFLLEIELRRYCVMINSDSFSTCSAVSLPLVIIHIITKCAPNSQPSWPTAQLVLLVVIMQQRRRSMPLHDDC